MAVKKTEEVKAEEVKNEEAKVLDPWEDMIKMRIPRHKQGETESEYVCVNDRRFLIPKDGTMQELPRPIAEVLEEKYRAEEEADAYIEEVTEKTNRKLKAL